MMSLASLKLACERAGVLQQAHGDFTVSVSGVVTDSRQTAAGQAYLALRGERFDGNDFAAAAVAAGAVALVLERHMPELAVPQLVVSDGLRALGAIAADWRQQWTMPLISVTGSNGKTTTTQMIAAILAQAFAPHAWFATRGNRNNEIGVPQMLLELTRSHQAAVLELGMNHVGEIAYLASLAKPTISVLTNAQREHQEFLSSVEQTALENGASIESLPQDGVAVIPADDPCAGIWRQQAGSRRVLDFGLRNPAAISAQVQSVHEGSLISLASDQTRFSFVLRMPGEHNARNAVAAASAALAAGLNVDAIVKGLEQFKPVSGRGVRVPMSQGLTLIDDTYNANPDSVRAAIDLLALEQAPRILVLGDMGEVGERGEAFHREVGAYAAQQGVTRLCCLGEATQASVAAFGAGAQHFESVDALIARVHELCNALAAEAGGVILVKGSRFMRMERVIAGLQALRHTADPESNAQPESLSHV